MGGWYSVVQDALSAAAEQQQGTRECKRNTQVTTLSYLGLTAVYEVRFMHPRIASRSVLTPVNQLDATS